MLKRWGLVFRWPRPEFISSKKWLPKTTCTSLENHGSFSSAKVGKRQSFSARPTNPSEPFWSRSALEPRHSTLSLLQIQVRYPSSTVMYCRKGEKRSFVVSKWFQEPEVSLTASKHICCLCVAVVFSQLSRMQASKIGTYHSSMMWGSDNVIVQSCICSLVEDVCCFHRAGWGSDKLMKGLMIFTTLLSSCCLCWNLEVKSSDIALKTLENASKAMNIGHNSAGHWDVPMFIRCNNQTLHEAQSQWGFQKPFCIFLPSSCYLMGDCRHWTILNLSDWAG